MGTNQHSIRAYAKINQDLLEMEFVIACGRDAMKPWINPYAQTTTEYKNRFQYLYDTRTTKVHYTGKR